MRCHRVSESSAQGPLKLQRGKVLGGHVSRRRNRNKLPKDIFGHLDVVVGDDQRFLNVLVGIALTHEVLNLTGEVW